LRTLLRAAKTQLLSFQAILHSLPKTTRGGGAPPLISRQANPVAANGKVENAAASCVPAWREANHARTSQCRRTISKPPSKSPSTATNRLTDAGYAYDAAGNMTNDGYNTMVYDGENRVASAVNSGAAGAYAYDGNSLRVKKCVPNCTSPTTTTVYIFSGSKVIAEYDNGAAVGSPSREYIYSGSALLAKIDSSGTKYYHQDHLSNRLVTDSNGNTAAQMGHYPFGESWYNTTGDKFLFTSYERDSESGNDYAMIRYNVNRLARFSSPDPLGGNMDDPQTLNRYTYTRNDPVNLADPSGLFFVDCGWYGTCHPGGGWADGPSASGGFLLFGCAFFAPVGVSEGYGVLEGFFCGPTPGNMPDTGDAGGGGGSDKKQILEKLRSKLYDKLLNDPDCLAFLGAKGAMVLDLLSTIPVNLDARLPGYDAWTTASRDLESQLPVNPVINFNPNGGGFVKGDQDFWGNEYGSPRKRALLFLHELGHATGALAHDRGSELQSAINSATIMEHCSKTIMSFLNK
jgi:RHS repeat-associated protein